MPQFHYDLAKHPLKLGHELVITSHYLIWMQFPNNTRILMCVYLKSVCETCPAGEVSSFKI